MTSDLAEIWSVYRPLSQESKTIEFVSIGYLKLQILNSFLLKSLLEGVICVLHLLDP
jgi:hypothetical protein